MVFRYLLAEEKFSEIIIFEQRSSLGGLWHYTPLPNQAQQYLNGDAGSAMSLITSDLPQLNTPMYQNLESNLPHIVMQFSDTPFPKTQLFAKRETVLGYIRDYGEVLRPMLRLEHRVLDVRRVVETSGLKWEILTRTKDEGTIRTEKFDAVVVAVNGHTNWPLLPNVTGLDAWTKAHPDSIFHSVSYKNPDAFKEKVSKLS